VSRQDYETPWELVELIEHDEGREFDVDLAARVDNAKALSFITPQEDSLSKPWASLYPDGFAWLNPPYERIQPWAEKCAYEGSKGLTIYFLVLASICSNWYLRYVYPYATTYAVYPRIVFIGEQDPFTKDVILCRYGPGAEPRKLEPFNWKRDFKSR